MMIVCFVKFQYKFLLLKSANSKFQENTLGATTGPRYIGILVPMVTCEKDSICIIFNFKYEQYT